MGSKWEISNIEIRKWDGFPAQPENKKLSDAYILTLSPAEDLTLQKTKEKPYAGDS